MAAKTKKSPAVRQVFLSSTARDLGPYRDAVAEAISGLDGFHCVRMEDFGARDWEADPFCRARVAECDVFVGLVGHLYGSSPKGQEASFTEREYEAAVEVGIPSPFSGLGRLAGASIASRAGQETPAAGSLPESHSRGEDRRRVREPGSIGHPGGDGATQSGVGSPCWNRPGKEHNC